MNRQLEMSHERLRALSRRLLEVQEEERGRLARDLHDDIGQALTALKIQLESIQRSGDPALRARVDEGVETVRHTLERVRQLSLSLRPPQLDDLGLAAALRSHLDRQASVAGLAPHFDASEAPQDSRPKPRRPASAWRRRQSTTSCGTRMRVISGCGSTARVDVLRFRCATTARGFDLAAARAARASGASLGLVGMEERIALAGGSFELRAAPGQGTMVLATFAHGAAQRGCMTIRVLLADDHALVRAGIRSLLGAMAE